MVKDIAQFLLKGKFKKSKANTEIFKTEQQAESPSK